MSLFCNLRQFYMPNLNFNWFSMPNFFTMPFFNQASTCLPICNSSNFLNLDPYSFALQNPSISVFNNSYPTIGVSSPLPALPQLSMMDTFTTTHFYANQTTTPFGSLLYTPSPINPPSSLNKTKRNKKVNSGSTNNKYLHYTTTKAAENAAKNDPNLEKLENVAGKVEIVSSSFITDIPYAKKGTTKILRKVSELIGEQLYITSALGTGHPENPHGKSGYESHHNADNPKLDIRVPNGYTPQEFADKLDKTGYFSHVLVHGTHIDVQIDIDKYSAA